MKRFILGLSIVGVVVVALAGATYVVVKNAIEQANKPVSGGPNTPAPFTYDQLEKMIDAKEAPADSEIPKLIACFDKSVQDPESGKQLPVGFAASEALARTGAEAVGPLRASLKDMKNAKARYYSAQTLARMGPIAAPAADDLLDRLQDANSDVRFKSAFALGQLGLQTDAIIEGLAKALDDPDGDVSRTAIDSLEKIGPPALPKMYQLVGAADSGPRDRLMAVLEKIGAPPADTLPLLAKLAKDPSDLVRQPAFKLLAQLGQPAIPTFKELLKKPSPIDLIVLPHALAMFPKDEAKELLPELQALLLEMHWWDAEPQLMETFKKCGPDGAKTLTNILKTLQDPTSKQFPDGAIRTGVALRMLGGMGADAKIAVPTLVELLKERTTLQAQILDAARRHRPRGVRDQGDRPGGRNAPGEGGAE